jgi:hypothetical protein
VRQPGVVGDQADLGDRQQRREVDAVDGGQRQLEERPALLVADLPDRRVDRARHAAAAGRVAVEVVEAARDDLRAQIGQRVAGRVVRAPGDQRLALDRERACVRRVVGIPQCREARADVGFEERQDRQVDRVGLGVEDHLEQAAVVARRRHAHRPRGVRGALRSGGVDAKPALLGRRRPLGEQPGGRHLEVERHGRPGRAGRLDGDVVQRHQLWPLSFWTSASEVGMETLGE